jgi:hypothetical protein
MTDQAINELIAAFCELGSVVHETRLKVEAAESVLKDASPELYPKYLKSLEAYREANRGRSTALADQSAYGRLRSALILLRIPQE